MKKIIALDGKTMRGNQQKGIKASHIVSAWSKEDGYSLGQKAVEEKSNEITAIPELLDKIQVKGHIITIDAMGTQTKIAEKNRSRRADYVLALKRNRSLGILKMTELSLKNKRLSMKTKRFVIGLAPIRFLEEVLNS